MAEARVLWWRSKPKCERLKGVTFRLERMRISENILMYQKFWSVNYSQRYLSFNLVIHWKPRWRLQLSLEELILSQPRKLYKVQGLNRFSTKPGRTQLQLEGQLNQRVVLMISWTSILQRRNSSAWCVGNALGIKQLYPVIWICTVE